MDIVLRGLPSEFAAIKTVIIAQFLCFSLPELKALLKAIELDIEDEKQASTVLSLTTMVVQTSLAGTTTSPISLTHTMSSQLVSPSHYNKKHFWRTKFLR